MHTSNFNDGLKPRGRRPVCVLVRTDGQGLLTFDGESIPGIVSASIEDREANGKWSNNTWKLECSDAIRSIILVPDFETNRLLPATTWGEALNQMRKLTGIDIDQDAFRRDWKRLFPTSAARYDRVDAEIASLASTPDEIEDAFRRALEGKS